MQLPVGGMGEQWRMAEALWLWPYLRMNIRAETSGITGKQSPTQENYEQKENNEIEKYL